MKSKSPRNHTISRTFGTPRGIRTPGLLVRSLKAEVADLLELKMNVPEVKMIPRIDKINKYLDDSIREVRETIKQMPTEAIHSWDELDALFLSELGK